ncbi:interaptin-like [Drosophila nasuta]|uniref:interaptin-like n=1 Tax=Drosophila nasuta TaxID=42062 RepID=UPI00295F4BE4|nr:interaptin-like [Drosophila nasuta]
MQTFLKLLAILFILVPRCTAIKEQEELQEASTKVLIAPVENQLKQCGEMEEKIKLLELQINETNKANQQLDEYKNQTEKQAAEIKAFSNKDELIANLKADPEIEDKLKLLEYFQLQIAKKELKLRNLQLTISSYENNTNNQSNPKNRTPQIVCPNYMVKAYNEAPKLKDRLKRLENKQKSCQMDLESERNGSIQKDVTIDNMKKEAEANRKLLENQWNETNYMNARIKEMEIVAENNKNLLDQCQENKRNMQKTEEEKKSVEEKLNECQLNNTNLVKLKDESFKEYQSNQQIILESCQDDLESQRNESTYKNVTIKELNKLAEFNHNLWTQCQKNREEIQTELDSYKTRDSKNNNLVESCKKQLESQKLETTSKNANINELNKGLDECKKNKEELNNQLITKEKCAKQCSGNNFFTKTWCKVKCKLNC